MTAGVSGEEKRARADELRKLSLEKGRQFSISHIDKDLEVLIEKERDPETGLLKGISGNYIKVLLSGPDGVMNRLRSARIVAVDGNRVMARLF
jgi:threonylcarbamoyladenosine tRNA methylthiotransferase MtaB